MSIETKEEIRKPHTYCECSETISVQLCENSVLLCDKKLKQFKTNLQ